jgi:alpha-aminoadipic semialdehyde synthase
MQSFKDLGLLEDQDKVTISSWSELLPTALSLKLKSKSSFGGVDMMRDNRTLEAVMQDIVPWDLAGKGAFGEAMSALEWLGLWSPVSLSSPARGSDGVKWMNGVIVPMTPYTPLELFAVVLAHRLRYAATERDMVVLSHEVVTRSPSADIEEVHKSTLVAYGDESASAMARTVGLPVAFAALDVLDGKVKMRGVTGPGQKEVYENVLTRLEEVGLGMVESVENVKVGSGSGTVEDSLCGSSM